MSDDNGSGRHSSRRDFLENCFWGGVSLGAYSLGIPQAVAGTTTTALSGTASNFGISAAQADLWFDQESLGAVGSQITTWANKGTLGTNFDLLYNSSLVSNGSVAASAVTVQNVGGKKAAYFNGSGWPTLHFRGVISGPTTSSNYYFTDGDGETNSSVRNRTIFWVYYTTTSYSTSSAFSAFGTYTSYTMQSNMGFSYNNSYMVIERSDSFPTNSSTGLFPPTVNSVAQAGHRQNGTSLGFWQNRSSAINTTISYSDNTAGAVGGASTSTDGSVKIGGIGAGRVGLPNNGYTLELIVFGSALSDADTNIIRTYLGTKYGASANT